MIREAGSFALPDPRDSHPPHITPRADHDLLRARELLKGIHYELANEHAFRQGTDGDESTLALHEHVSEISEIMRRYYPSSAFEDDFDDE